MERLKRVPVLLELHPEDYRRMREAAVTSRMSENDFYALAMHKGIGLLRDLRRDALPVDVADDGEGLKRRVAR